GSGRAVVGGDLCRHHPPLWRQKTRGAAGHAGRIGGESDRHGTAGGGRRVNANLHAATGRTHSFGGRPHFEREEACAKGELRRSRGVHIQRRPASAVSRICPDLIPIYSGAWTS